MKAACILMLSLCLSGCASYPFGKDQMCRQLATFANAARPAETLSVSLQTAWGPSKLRPNVLSWRHCDHGASSAATTFCRYLLTDSAVEFPQNNLRRVVACLRRLPLRTGNFVQYNPINVQASAFDAYGVREGVEVSVQFAPDTKSSTMQLTITAKAFPSVHE